MWLFIPARCLILDTPHCAWGVFLILGRDGGCLISGVLKGVGAQDGLGLPSLYIIQGDGKVHLT